MNQANALGVNRKLGVFLLVSVMGMAAILLVFYQAFSRSLYSEKRAGTQRQVDAGIGVIRHFYEKEQAGAMSRSEAQALSMEALKSATFGDTGYFWINDGAGVLLMNPYTPELIGKNMLNTVDHNGFYLFKDFVRLSKEGGGWSEYYWPKPGMGGAYRKVSNVAYFKPWNWVLGSGLYLDDMEREIRHNSLRIAGILLVALIALVAVFMALIRRFMTELQSLAIRDHLTGLYTRRYLVETLGNLLLLHDRHIEKNLCVIFLDIDHFKRVNDTHGHGKGDQVLREIGRVIRESTRPDDLCIRYGGEEFVVVVLASNPATARSLTERIRSAAHETVFPGAHEPFSITLSAGIATRRKGEAFDSLLARADAKLYQAKANGRDCIVE